MNPKLTKLKEILKPLPTVIVAFSGGIDSTLLLKIAHDVLGNNVIAITAASPSMPATELEEAQALAQTIGVDHILLPGRETEDPRYRANTPERCYFCRQITLTEIRGYAHKNGFQIILDGNNADDIGDYRPGRKAAQEHGVRSPLQEVGLTKTEIRELAKTLGLSNWNKPAAACLSSRVPYGTPITPAILAQIDRAEAALQQMGFGQLRVRHHNAVARLEIHPNEFNAALKKREAIIAALKAAGYTYITLDLAGFRSGALNEVL